MPDIFVSEPNNTPEQKPEAAINKTPLKNISVPTEGGSSVHLLTAYCENPNDISFKNQGGNENVLLFVRKHLATNFKWIAIGIIMALVPILTGPLLNMISISLPVEIPSNFILLFTLFYYLALVTYLFIKYITWYFNVSLVTNLRIVDIDFSDIIYKNMASTKISLVQDVSYSQTGVFRTFFHYGDVLVQTAGETPQFDFDAVPNPENVVHIVGELIGKHGTV